MFLLPTVLSFVLRLSLLVPPATSQHCKLNRESKRSVQQPLDPSIPSPSISRITNSSSTNSISPTGTSSIKSQPSSTPFVYGRDKVRGVNLGGWFVLEPWITPSIFENTGNDAIVDEYTFGQMQNRQDALRVLENHWQTWIVEDDFRQIRAAGLNHVRIPLGYWSIPLTSKDTQFSTDVSPYIAGAWPYFRQALDWAKSHSLNVIVDIHGAPGSQNGYDNSGQRTQPPMWASNQSYVQKTVDCVTFLAKTVGDKIDILEVMNEPAGFLGDDFTRVLRQYYTDTYNTIRATVGNGTGVMFSDGFRGLDYWGNSFNVPQYQRTSMDIHMYQIFSNLELSRSLDQHIEYACNLSQSFVGFESSNIWTVVGEWSNALTDCAKWLNGRGVGARWEGKWGATSDQHFFASCQGYTGDSSTFSKDLKDQMRKYFEVQIEVGERVQGWVFWTWKVRRCCDIPLGLLSETHYRLRTRMTGVIVKE
ncbi:glycoside hydrolase [Thelephora ganbajun]|uniref:Glycoside hydrolase n=1 Tax=Thelephora ganbajun TaxID=370292 RepID=A0ACB6ZES7_THEGA|nr:glycoside hydrolase [Thelephora ganbajun]